MGILQCELAKQAVPSKASSSFKGGENINSKIQRRDFLSKQAQIMSQWITDMPLGDTAARVTSGAAQNLLAMQIASGSLGGKTEADLFSSS